MSRPKKVTPMEFVGAQMSNFLYGIAQDASVPARFRATAKELQTKWDSVSRFQLNNPIMAAELEKRLFR